MLLRRYIPRPPLSAFVSCLWYSEGAPNTHSKERLLPNGETAMIFNLRDEPLRIYDALNIGRHNSYGSAVLSGARANCFVIDTCQQERVIGIQFRAGGAFPFFRMPACELEGESLLWTTFGPCAPAKYARGSSLRKPLTRCSRLSNVAC
jgi:hypothetical protein